MPGYNTDAFLTYTGIPQSSPHLTILFMFNNANLLDACNSHTLPGFGISFVYDVNELAFSKTTDENCRTLQSIHKRCLEWALKHSALFAREVYPCALHQSRDQAQHRLSPHPYISHNIPQPIRPYFRGHS
jgi:hypothetical protein